MPLKKLDSREISEIMLLHILCGNIIQKLTEKEKRKDQIGSERKSVTKPWNVVSGGWSEREAHFILGSAPSGKG